MTRLRALRLIFVSDRDDPHRKRFSTLFSSLTEEYFEVIYSSEFNKFVSSHPDFECQDWQSLRQKIEEEPSLVVSGPLDTVSVNLAGGKYRHVGISWATDVMVFASESFESLMKLGSSVRQLDLILTDNFATENCLVAMGVQTESILRGPWGPDESSDEHPTCEVINFGFPADRELLLAVRSVEPHYEPETVIKAFAEVARLRRKAHLVLIRRGTAIKSVQNLIDSLGITEKVTWVGDLKPSEFGQLIGAMSVVISSAQTDGTSVSVMEAMARGVPVVSTLTNGSAEWLVDGVTGWTYPPGLVRYLAEKLSCVLDMPANRRAAVVSNAQRLVRVRAGWNRTSGEVASAISSLMIGQ